VHGAGDHAVGVAMVNHHGAEIADISRGCTVTDIVNTVAITAVQAQTGSPST